MEGSRERTGRGQRWEVDNQGDLEVSSDRPGSQAVPFTPPPSHPPSPFTCRQPRSQGLPDPLVHRCRPNQQPGLRQAQADSDGTRVATARTALYCLLLVGVQLVGGPEEATEALICGLGKDTGSNGKLSARGRYSGVSRGLLGGYLGFKGWGVTGS